MTSDTTNRLQARLETGFRTDSAYLKELEDDLTVTLHCARHFGTEGGSPDWRTIWNEQWDGVEAILRRIGLLVNEMDRAVEGSRSDRLTMALEAWHMIQTEDTKLVEALKSMRTHASGLNAAVREDWSILARRLETHLETIHACARALRSKLRLLKEHSRDEANHAARDILSNRPNGTGGHGVDAESAGQECRTAAIQVDEEHHQFPGFMDVVKGLLMWVETTDERVLRNRSAGVEQAVQSDANHSLPSIAMAG